ncbi:hypothetical protein LINPERPRIM_LOCUS14001 [Linum perenne]
MKGALERPKRCKVQAKPQSKKNKPSCSQHVESTVELQVQNNQAMTIQEESQNSIITQPICLRQETFGSAFFSNNISYTQLLKDAMAHSHPSDQQ